MAKTKPSKSKSASTKSSKKSSKREKSLLNSTGHLSSNPHSSKSVANDVSTLVRAASALLHAHSQPAEAFALTSHAVSLAPQDLPTLDLHALCAVELGELDTAREAFAAAAALDPAGAHETASGTGPEKFLWLAQLNEDQGVEAVGWYERAAEVLRGWIAQGTDKDRGCEEKLVSALCGAAELYLTDLCFEKDAEERCECYLAEALLVGPNSAEAWMVMGNLRVVQQRTDSAVEAARRSFETWRDRELNDPDIPSYASRIKLAQLLIETAQYETALEVLERLQDEDDQLPDLWYLGGLCNYRLGKDEKTKDPERWTELWQEARIWLHNCETLCTALEWEDEGIQEHTAELLQEIADANIPERVEEEGGGEDGEDEDWESDSDAEMGGA